MANSFFNLLPSLLVICSFALTAIAAPRNIVLIVVDDQGLDGGCYGSRTLRTPHLDALAADGVVLDQAFCTTASCSASRSVILTGLYNHANGQYGHQHAYHHFHTFANTRSLPVRLSDAGYRTARIGKYHVQPESVYRFDDVLPGNGRNAAAMAENCRDVIEADDERPFFLYFCTTDPHRSGDYADELPHAPNRFGNRPGGYPGVETHVYDPADVEVPPFLPDTPVCRAELAQYYQSVDRIDQGLGRLVEILKAAGRYDDTLIVYLSDNGIAFPGAKTTLYEPGMRLPCIVRNPYSNRRGRRSEALVNWADLAPTLLDFAGVEAAPGEFHGRSFLAAIEEDRPAGWDQTFASHTFHEITMYYPMRVVRERRYKLIWNIAHPLPYPFASDLWEAPTWQDVLTRGAERYGVRRVEEYLQRPEFELFDLEADPHEIENLADSPEHAETLARMQADLKEFQRMTGDPWILKWDYE